MPHTSDAHAAELVEQAISVAMHRLPEEQVFEVAAFVRAYYSHVPPQDIVSWDADTLFGAAFSHWRLAAQRTAKTARVRVYNPRLDEHGWRCAHTVIEIVNDNMPFLVDSVTAALNRHDLIVHLVIHPVLLVRRDSQGRRLNLATATGEGVVEESFINVLVNQLPESGFEGIAATVHAVLADVRAAVSDWSAMRDQLTRVIAELPAERPPMEGESVNEVRDFLTWLQDNNFTFLGFRRYALREGGAAGAVAAIEEAGLGLLRRADMLVFDDLSDGAPLPLPVQAFLKRPDLLVVAKANRVSPVHRSVHMDAVAVKAWGPDGGVKAVDLFAGLFAASAYNRSVRSIPLLRGKLEQILARAGFDPRGHDGRALANIVENYPRDELFQVGVEQLFPTVIGILNLQQRQRVALFIRRDDFDRYIGCLIFIPRDRYTTELRITIQSMLERAFAGRVTAHYAQVGDAPLARLQMFVKTAPGQIPAYDPQVLEQEIITAVHSWSDRLRDLLIARLGEERGLTLARRYAEAFAPGYTSRFSPLEALADIEQIERACIRGGLELYLYRPFGVADDGMRIKVFQPETPIILSQVLPVMEHLGLRVIDEVPHEVRIGEGSGRRMLIHDFGVEAVSGADFDVGALQERFRDIFLAVWRGDVESDLFNALVMAAGLSRREVVLVRAYAKYLRQAGIAFSLAYMQQALLRHAAITRRIVEMFTCSFDPDRQPDADAGRRAIRERLDRDLEDVTSADDDRILRRLMNAVDSTLRTNYFQRSADGASKPYLSFKLDSRRLDELPPPRPLVEVFVYSPRMEGIHLRGGKVARGGIRWSDRREDFRTEILGLMKAQTVKNAVIVPVGAKGGFVVKRPPAGGDREAVLAEGIECYRMLIRGLLDITDNLAGGAVLPPAATVRRDGDDPYLVVAADKGTATFSDIANALSAEYGFWLGDAFASGGSVGYDHKKMGITARGAWVSVMRHFRELGRNIQEESFTVVGVGDMSGDVFGNGMLLSRHILLIGAFNHLHIFVDPDPNPTVGFAERSRLFALPRSSWSDYDQAALSSGGQVFDRRAKWVSPSPEVRARFGITQTRLTPNELIQAMLKSDVDLLWLGGIGTYVKAAGESHADVGDRSNDSLRVNGADLRCKVIGEGANLGVTQLGRIEYALAGGRLNTDFIDNSAGVDCSDHEVNIKILLDAVVADGDITGKQRNRLLAEMSDEVGALVLRDNYLQTQAISQFAAEAGSTFDAQVRLMRFLERSGRLNRAVEFLPDDETLNDRAAARTGLTRPEIAVLFSYAKIWLYDEILPTDLPDDPHFARDAEQYFPTPIRERFRDRVPDHRLRRELVATLITNSVINRVGGRLLVEIADEFGVSATDVTRAYVAARDVFPVRELWIGIEALDNAVPPAMQVRLQQDVRRLLERCTRWFLRNGGAPLDIFATIARFRTPVTAIATDLGRLLPPAAADRLQRRVGSLTLEGIPESLAHGLAAVDDLPAAGDVVLVAQARGLDVAKVARLYFGVGGDFGFGWLNDHAERLVTASHWEKRAVAAISEELSMTQRIITERVLDAAGEPTLDAVDVWVAERRAIVDRHRALLAELQSASVIDLAMLTFAGRQLAKLAAS